MNGLKLRVKEMLIEHLKLEGLTPGEILDEAPLFGEGLGLDSIDALKLVLGIEQVFGVKIQDEAAGMKAFKSMQALTNFIAERSKV